MSSARKPIPREVLFGNPEKAAPKLSPDGRHFAYLAPDEGVLNIWAGRWDDPSSLRPVTKDRDRGIRSYFWAEDHKSLLFVQDRDGDENWHLYQSDIAGSTPKDLTPFPEVQAQVVGTDPKFPHEVLIGLNARDKRVHDVHRLDLRTGRLTLEVENPGSVTGWLADTRFRVRCAKAMRPDGGTELLVRDTDAGEWRSFISWGPDDSGGAHGFTPDNKGLYIESSHDSDTTALWEMSLDGASRKILALSVDADLGAVLLHPTDFHAEAAAFERDRLEWTVLDEKLKPDFEALSKLCDGDYHIVSRDDADTAWLVLYNRDTKPPCYYRYDRRAKTGTFLFTTRPKLADYELSPMQPVKIKARDGLTLQAYLTVPAGAKAEKLPLVLNVHGGPWVRDAWGFHPEAQWLADQGYAVLQVNYRGSMGFGKAFLHAGDREWGAKMQDDLTDSVRWAIKEGIANPAQIAIYGGSYGGYAALAGAAFTPDLYCCAVDIVGPSNIATLIRSIPPYWEPMRRIFDLRVGNVDTEPDFLKERSPLFSADRIQIPLLIAQGANDPRVKQAESEMIVEALRSSGKPVEYLLFPDEGHGFAKPENRLRFYAAAEEFLAKHLRPGRKPQPAAAPPSGAAAGG
ncbi:MAG: S9 family peptidase [Elusimicrobia bacterium]|nr:S9 family peptidase [Elusimicrobiota bacterium]